MLIAGFIPESFVDWRGKIVATVFTYGCNFRCPFCHNHSLVLDKPTSFLKEDEVIERIKELKGWIDGVCITGGEPTIHEDIVEFVKEIKKFVEVKLDTNGSRPNMLRELLPHVSYVAMDIKAPRERYGELAGVDVDIEKIDESIEIIKKGAKDYEFRTTAVPVLTYRDFERIGEWIKGAKRYVIQQYSTAGGTLDPSYSKLYPLDREYLKNICASIRDKVESCIVANI